MSDTRWTGLFHLSFLPIPALIVLIAMVYLTVDPSLFYDPPWLILIGNGLFITLVSFVVSYIALKNYKATGRIQIFLLGCGVLLFGIGGLLAAIVRGLPGGANLNVTIYNTGALLGAAFHFIAAIMLLAGVSHEAGFTRRGTWLIFGYGGSVLFMAVFAAASFNGVIPPFFIQGMGPTLLRQEVLGTADIMFVFSFFIFMRTYLRNKEVFLYWYACALALTAISLTAFFFQSSVGSAVGWVGRSSQYLGGIYFLASLVTASQTAQTRKTSLDNVLTASLSSVEEKFRALAENTPDVIRRFDRDLKHIYVNQAGLRLYGKSAGAVIGKPLREVGLPEVQCKLWIERIQKVFKTGQRIEVEDYLPINKGMGFYLSQCIPEYGPDGTVTNILVISRDLTERKHAEEALRKANDELELRVRERTLELEKANLELEAKIVEQQMSEEKIREQAELLDKAQDAIDLRDLDHHLIYWNKGAERLYGWKAEEIMYKNADELLYKEESPNLAKAKKSAIEDSEWKGELNQITKDRKEIIVESHWTLMRDNEGKPKSILIINTDISEKKKFESQLLRAQRMESIGTLASGLAHDFNNILTPMMLSLEMLKDKFSDEQSQTLLTILERNSLRGADLIKQVLSFARGVEGERNPLQVKDIITEIEKIIKETFPRNIEIRTGLKKDLFIISGDATQLHQVIMNMCVNARDAMPDGGVLEISAENFFIDENYMRMHIEAKVGSYVVIGISDTGTGIPPKILDRIFEPFFTTKEFGKGTGLGLSTALAIAKSHGGFINVNSEVGKGTTFRIYLPMIKTEKQTVEEQGPEMLIGHGELVLVAEDEASIREVTVSILDEHGYNVLAANNGADAVALYAQNKYEINIVLMDMMMPVMDGEASIRAIHKINPEVKVIVVSGLAEIDKLAKIESTHAQALISKPYTAGKLLETIHKVISAE